MKTTTTLSMAAPIKRREILSVSEGQFKVLDCTGSGPYMLAVRPVNWRDRLLWRIGSYLKAPAYWVRSRLDPEWDYRYDEEEDERKPRNTLPYALGGGAVLLAGIVTIIASQAVYHGAVPDSPWYAGWGLFLVGGATVLIAGAIQAVRDKVSRD